MKTVPLGKNESLTLAPRAGYYNPFEVKGSGLCPRCGDKIQADEPQTIICWACDKHYKHLKDKIAEIKKHAWCKKCGHFVCWKDMAPTEDNP